MGECGESIGGCEEVGCAETVVGVDLDFGLGRERRRRRGSGGRHGRGLFCFVLLEGNMERDGGWRGGGRLS